MIRVAIVFEYPTVNGGENSMLAVLDYLQSVEPLRRQFEFHAIAPDEGPLARRLEELRIELTDFDRERLPQILNQVGADLVHGNSLSTGRLLGALYSDGQIAPRATAHLRDIMRLSAAAVRNLNHLAGVVTVSHATKQFHVGQGLDADRACVIWNGIDAAAFTSGETQRCVDEPLSLTGSPGRRGNFLRTPGDVRAEIGISASDQVVLAVGQIGLRKGFDTLAQAAVKLSESIPNLHYLLAGVRFSMKQESIEHETRIRETFASARGRLRFHPLGFRTDVAQLMSAADLLVHPARQEPLGRVLLEASAAQLPIVATDVGGTREILQDEESALLVRPDDPDALTAAMQRLLTDRPLAARLAQQACAIVQKRFTTERAANELTDFWQHILNCP